LVENPIERRLVAILVADIVGYSRLVEQDEAETLTAIKSLRGEVIDPLLAQHHSRIVKLTGDGAIVQFGSVVDAVNSSVAIQKETAARQTEVPPGRRIVFRIGINLGDVVAEDGDLLGDGVNVAARLEQLCDPGGVLISGTAYDQLQGKFDRPLDYAGEQHMKNIARPVRTYHIRFEDGGRPWRLRLKARSRQLRALATAAILIVAGGGAWLLLGSDTIKSGSPAIAVLPFENLNGDQRWDRFADGMTEDIITDLARYRDLAVIARTSTEAYRDKPPDVREIGDALDVKYVLEGSLQVDGHRLRVTAQLIDAESGAHIWSERYDRFAEELLDVQDEITQKIAITLTGWQGQVTEAERTIARRKNATDLDAYDYWLLGIEAKHKMTVESLLQARTYFEKGLKLAPDFMPLVRDMGITYQIDMDIGSPYDYPAWLDAMRKYTERAFALDPNDPNTNFMMGLVYGYQGNEEQAERYRALAQKFGSNNADTMMQLAWAYSGWDTERALELVERTLKLNPRYPSWWNFPITYTYFAARQFAKAYAAAKQVGESPNQAAYVAMTSAQLGKKQEAADAAAKVLRLKAAWTVESMYPYQNYADETLLTESAGKAGLPICMTSAQASAYSGEYRLKQCEDERARAAAPN
jgi:TolB-like protein/class 3 adenylate cyclase